LSYEIPKEIKSPIKLIFSLYAKDLSIIGVGTLFLLNVGSEFVHNWFTIPYYIVGFGALLFMVMSSSTNPGKRNYVALYFLIKRNKTTYHPIDANAIENESKYSNENKEEKRNEYGAKIK